MRIAKLLSIAVALVSAMLVIGLSPAGDMFAAKQPLLPGHSTNVSGPVEPVDWIHGDPADMYFENPNWVLPGDVLTFKLHGDIEGTYVMLVSFIVPPPYDGKVYYFKGQALFSGKVMGEEASWATDVNGGGKETSPPNVGKESWDSAILSATPCMSGSISITGSFDFINNVYDYTYVGTLHFDCRDKAK
jgi:hypothetical protein